MLSPTKTALAAKPLEDTRCGWIQTAMQTNADIVFSQRCLPLYSTIHINNGVPACPIGIMRSKKSFQSRHEGLTPSDIFLGKGD